MSPATPSIATADGLDLQGEWEAPEQAYATVVLCHPHPQYGGSMRSIVISTLFDALPRHGIACLRFNFRGVELSEGVQSEGEDEPLDVVAAIDTAVRLAGDAHIPGPLVLVGWSFGADIALAVDDPRIAAWIGIAPPMRFRPARSYRATGADARRKLLLLAEYDDFRDASETVDDTKTWRSTQVEVIAGASHFFVGCTERVVAAVAAYAAEVAGVTR